MKTNQRKRLLSLALAIAMISTMFTFGALTVSAAAGDPVNFEFEADKGLTEEEGEYTLTLEEEDSATITMTVTDDEPSTDPVANAELVVVIDNEDCIKIAASTEEVVETGSEGGPSVVAVTTDEDNGKATFEVEAVAEGETSIVVYEADDYNTNSNEATALATIDVEVTKAGNVPVTPPTGTPATKFKTRIDYVNELIIIEGTDGVLQDGDIMYSLKVKSFTDETKLAKAKYFPVVGTIEIDGEEVYAIDISKLIPKAIKAGKAYNIHIKSTLAVDGADDTAKAKMTNIELAGRPTAKDDIPKTSFKYENGAIELPAGTEYRFDNSAAWLTMGSTGKETFDPDIFPAGATVYARVAAVTTAGSEGFASLEAKFKIKAQAKKPDTTIDGTGEEATLKKIKATAKFYVATEATEAGGYTGAMTAKMKVADFIKALKDANINIDNPKYIKDGTDVLIPVKDAKNGVLSATGYVTIAKADLEEGGEETGIIATTSTLTVGATDPTIEVTTTKKFKATLEAADFTIEVGTTGLGATPTVTRNSDTKVTFEFTGTVAAGDLTIQAKKAAFDPAESADSNTLKITAAEEGELEVSATISNVEVTDTTPGDVDNDITATITLTGDTFKDVDDSTNNNVTAWFTNAPSGVTVEVTDITNISSGVIEVTFGGTGIATASTDTMAITIPAANLTTSTDSVTVTENAEAKWTITGAV